MINILKLRKLEKEKNKIDSTSSEINNVKEESESQNKLTRQTELVADPADNREINKKKPQKKTGKKVTSEASKKPKVQKKEIEIKVKKLNKNIIETEESEIITDNSAEIKELMDEINEIENELKELEEEDFKKEENIQQQKQMFIDQGEIPDKSITPDSNGKQEFENIETKSAGKLSEENVKANVIEEIDQAEILRQNLLKELLADENISIPEVKTEKIEETAETEPVNRQEKPFIKNDDIPLASEKTVRSQTFVPQIKEEKPIQEINKIISAVQNNEYSAKEELKKKSNENIVQLVGFMLSNEYYGVDIMKIREIIRMVDITKVPRSPRFIEGVINLRGSVIPVINLRTKIRMPRLEYDKNTRIVIVEINGTVVGFIVDAVREVLRIQESVLEPPPSITIEKADYITSVAKLEDQLVILMDTEKVLSNEEGKTLTEMSR